MKTAVKSSTSLKMSSFRNTPSKEHYLIDASEVLVDLSFKMLDRGSMETQY